MVIPSVADPDGEVPGGVSLMVLTQLAPEPTTASVATS
ncbi:hypothetical protein MMMB2_1932 [Mycobacterium marinum MB2]|nr:hypothetical protein MMMB2_1932 [Mycobacterium marinum MB2]